ncbi:FlgB family protein [Rhodobacter calidifons]|uniref:FlgB family protein n=1 Tax=Rhodobacter calidifons TaxID=2715277 RepID=A0ABX0G724_9RHOB|nr:FlgB family protein [Rhodobacter calidifons]NHB76680.1 FlgB family protein [Rhodobacter calidifons]
MFEKLDLTRMAQALAAHSGARMAVIAENVANADTPGYKARDLPAFAEVFHDSGVSMRATRRGHLTADRQAATPIPERVRGHAAPNGNSVSLEAEMVKSVEARQSHDMALAIYRATSEVIRSSLGRPR